MESGIEKFTEILHGANMRYADEVPSATDTQAFVEKAMDLLFPFRMKSEGSIPVLKRRLREMAGDRIRSPFGPSVLGRFSGNVLTLQGAGVGPSAP